MKQFNKSTNILIFTFIITIFLFTSCTDDDVRNDPLSIIESSAPIQDQYIVVLKSDYEGKTTRKKLGYDAEIKQLRKEIPSKFSELNISNDQIKQTYGFALKGFTAVLNSNQLEKLRMDPRVKSIEQDYIISLGKPSGTPGGGGGGTDPAQETPWGINRIGGTTDGTGKTAWIIDSGIDSDHPDINVDVNRSRSYVTKGKYSIEDGNGHGTHVAGTVAALNNNIGVVGVAAGATIVALRVLDSRGSGQFSWTISALDYIAANGSAGDAVNMSLGPQSRYTDTAVDGAAEAVASLGIRIAIAAGNSSDDSLYYSPARVGLNNSNIYTVASMTSSDSWSSFSNYGTPVDVIAPGSSVKSTYKDGGYATLSGTSMASPHVCGLLLLGNVTTDGSVTRTGNSDSYPIAHN
ncbi:peptidase inhibitor I9 [Lutibacter oceani]|uniref:Peptidase inhibitor I9 n=1 Tax=Lutibacter oceani TaxID=1853311 RepID=A0A3D9RJA8_9FLAO|nr:S8 family serine peptidase [Lutibacter oceani]REE79973.1 peptidase inhibitor I9 [Lutibacter oceani]